MTILYRPMQPADVEQCAGIVGRHAVLASRYGDTIRHLAVCWRQLLGSEGFIACVFEEIGSSNSEVLGAAVAVFVSDDFIRELKCHPFWIGPELALRVARDESPVLSDNLVREANSRGGLNLAVWQSGPGPENVARYEVGVVIMNAFTETIRGFQLKESVTQAETLEQVGVFSHTGSLLWDNRKGSYQEFSDFDPAELVSEPHVVGLSRDLARGRIGSWIGSIFLYQSPRLGFRRSEQRLLLAALGNATDQELSDKLGISLSTVKKTWRSIYDRAALCSPDLVPSHCAEEDGSSERGKGKKQRLTAYLREHPEELRPVAWKLLRDSNAQTRQAGRHSDLASAD
jgi:hypothetical protein